MLLLAACSGGNHDEVVPHGGKSNFRCSVNPIRVEQGIAMRNPHERLWPTTTSRRTTARLFVQSLTHDAVHHPRRWCPVPPVD